MTCALELGQIIVTPRAEEELAREGTTVDQLLARHVTGDAGNVATLQRVLNLLSNEWRMAVVSTYETAHGEEVTVYTTPDRSSTLVHMSPSKKAFRRHTQERAHVTEMAPAPAGLAAAAAGNLFH